MNPSQSDYLIGIITQTKTERKKQRGSLLPYHRAERTPHENQFVFL